jgi:hypothetical protein
VKAKTVDDDEDEEDEYEKKVEAKHLSNPM